MKADEDRLRHGAANSGSNPGGSTNFLGSIYCSQIEHFFDSGAMLYEWFSN